MPNVDDPCDVGNKTRIKGIGSAWDCKTKRMSSNQGIEVDVDCKEFEFNGEQEGLGGDLDDFLQQRMQLGIAENWEIVFRVLHLKEGREEKVCGKESG